MENQKDYERVTRSKASVTKKDDDEVSSLNKDPPKIIESFNENIEDPDALLEQKQKLPIKQNPPEKKCINPKIEAKNPKNNVIVSSSMNNFQQSKKLETPTFIKKNSPSPKKDDIYQTILKAPVNFNRSKLIKKALVSSKNKDFKKNISQKSVSDSTNDSQGLLMKSFIKKFKNFLFLKIKKKMI